MKELSIENKAKAYDEAFNVALETYQTQPMYKNWLEKMFPELREESEDERIRKELLTFFRESIHGGHILTNKEYDSWIAWLEKQAEQKPADTEKGAKGNEREIPISVWSEEDEKMIRGLIAVCDEWTTSHSFYPIENCNIEKLKNWLKSLKDRVQPKQEWSEEDKAILEKCIGAVKTSCYSHSFKLEAENWLKSLRPQNWTKEDKERYISCLQRLGTGDPEQPETINSKWFKEHVYPQTTWKPSDEQIVAIDTAINVLGKGTLNGKQLIELQEQLKKLKG